MNNNHAALSGKEVHDDTIRMFANGNHPNISDVKINREMRRMHKGANKKRLLTGRRK